MKYLSNETIWFPCGRPADALKNEENANADSAPSEHAQKFLGAESGGKVSPVIVSQTAVSVAKP